MIFRLTEKLARKLKVDKLPRTDIIERGSVWHGNLFRARGVQHIILTESLTLYSLLFFGRGIVDGPTMAKTARGLIENRFQQNGWNTLLGSSISYDEKTPLFLAAQDRSVLSSQNEIVRIVKAQLEDQSMDYDYLLAEMNIIPLTKNGVMEDSERRVERLLQTGRNLKTGPG